MSKPLYIVLLVFISVSCFGIVKLRDQDRRNRESIAAERVANEQRRARFNAQSRELQSATVEKFHQIQVDIAKRSAEYEGTLGGFTAAQAALKLETTLLRLEMKRREELDEIAKKYP